MMRRWTGNVARRAGVSVILMTACLASVLAWALAPSAAADPVERTPLMGWSSWSFLRFGVDTQRIEAEAKALVTTGLKKYGYDYVNVDDNWYVCPGSQGPKVDSDGRWVVDSQEFPNRGSENGLAAVAAYVHRLGLKFGIYETPGISKQAVKANTPVAGTSYTADEIATKQPQNNYNCGGMVGLNYSSPGAQDFVDSVVDELASWGIDYIKLDGITNRQGAVVQAWSRAVAHSGRPMVLNITQGSYTIKLAPTLKLYANQWEFAPDIEINGPDEGSGSTCNTPPYTGCRSVFPFTSYAHWFDRFNDVAQWQPYGGPGGFNDYDSIEVGDGASKAGMSPAAEKSQLSLWALGSAPLILCVNLTSKVINAFGSSGGLTPADRRLLTNRRVIAVDQDAIDASRIAEKRHLQIFAKREAAGDAVAGLFNTDESTGAHAELIATTAAAVGLPADRAGYRIVNLWSGATRVVSAKGTVSAEVPPEGVALLRVTPIAKAH
jgi:Alpha galactosidase A/Alpha galactosidase C-terminal beta sandwich domain